MSASHVEQQSTPSVEVRLAGDASSTPSQRKTGTIVVKFTAQDAKNFIVSGDGSRGFKVKLPLKLKLTADPNDPHAKPRARLILSDQEPIKLLQKNIQNAESTGGVDIKAEQSDLPQLTSLAADPSEGGPPQALIPIEETGDLFLEALPLEQPFDCNWKSVSDFFYSISEQLISKPIYSVLLDQDLVQGILVELVRSHLNFQQIQQLLSLVFDYFALSKNQSLGSSRLTPLPTSLQLRNFAEVVGVKWRRLREEVFAANKSILKVLDYIQPKCEGEGSRYTHCYFNLRFDMSEEDVSKVAEAVKYQCRYNHKAFCFLTNYLLRACRRMEQHDNACIRQIEDTLVATINRLIKDHPSSSSLEGEEQLLQRHPSFCLDRTHYPIRTLHLRNFPRDRKIQVLQGFIELCAKDAQRNSGAFARLIKDVCSHLGSNMTTGVKIKSMRKRRAVERVKEKVLDGISLQHRAELLLDVNPNLPINAYTEAEFEQYKNRLNAIFLSLEQSIQFGVDDLLRGRCMFQSLDALNGCCQQLKEEIPRRGYQLLSLRNRLKEKSCDIVLQIRIGKTVAELQLVLNYKLAQNEFSSKLNHLRRALFYNHITHLKLTNEKLTYLFLEEALAYVRDNTRTCSNKDYKEKTNYKDAKDNLNRFIKELPFKVDRAELDEKEMELSMLAAEVKQFNTIVEFPAGHPTASLEKLKYNGDFLYQLANYNLSLQSESQYCRNVEQKHKELISSTSGEDLSEEERLVLKNYAGAIYVIGKIHMRAKDYNPAVEYLQRSEKLTQLLGNRDEYVVETLQHLGEIQYRRNNLPKAVGIYTRLVQFQESSNQRSSQQYAQTLLALALVYQHQGNYFQAVRNLQRILPIIEREKGKQNIHLATIYNHLGATHHLDGSLPASLEAYRRSLAIVEREKGRNSVDCASALANIALIYETDCNYYQAAKHYEQAMAICSKHNLKEGTYANAAFGLGKCYSALKNFSKAIETYNKAIGHFQKQKGQMYYALMTEIAVAYEGLGEDEKANQYYDKLHAQ